MPTTLVTLNTQHAATAPVRAIARVLHGLNPDVVLLQEVDRRALRSGLSDQAMLLRRGSGLQHAFYAASVRRGLRRYGLLVLSRFPLVEETIVPLPHTGHEEPRIAQLVRVDIPTAPLLLANVHLSTDQASGAVQLARLLEVLPEGMLPVVIGGDFNGQPVPAGFTAVPDGYTWPAVRPRATLDRIMVRDGTGCTITGSVVDLVPISDHLPVVAQVQCCDCGTAE